MQRVSKKKTRHEGGEMKVWYFLGRGQDLLASRDGMYDCVNEVEDYADGERGTAGHFGHVAL